MKLLKDNTGENLDDLRHGNDFLDLTPKAWFLKETVSSLRLKTSALHKLKKKRKRQVT